MYKRLTQGLNDRGILISSLDDPYDHISNMETDWYLSTFLYNDEHKAVFDNTGSVSGITDVICDSIWWDFDSEVEPEQARKATVTLCKRLIEYGISHQDLIITFSGNKGYGVELNLTQHLTPKEVKNIAFELASDLKPYFDVKMYNASRILRVMGTTHQKTGLYKTPLSFGQLQELSHDAIINLAKTTPRIPADSRWEAVSLPEKLQVVKKKEPALRPVEDKKFNVNDIDFTHKVKGWTNCKWALLNGYQVKTSDRHEKLLCIIAQARALNNTKEQAYQLAKEADRYGVSFYGGERIVKEELWTKVESVYSDSWKGGTFTCKDGKTTWLTEICASLGNNKCVHEKETDLSPKTFADLKDDFKHYVKNIEKNTISTGLPSIDKHVFLSTGANVVLVGAAGSGKTSFGLEFLENTSRAGVRSVVASLDMAKNRIFEKVMYRISGLPRQDLYKLFKDDKEAELMRKLNESYSNVNFFKKTSPTVQDIKEYVMRCNENQPNKIKLVVVDYFERITTDMGDETAASKKISGELQDLVDDLDICLIVLYQPNKNALSGGPDSPIYDYTKIKGSSFVYQAPRIILSCWRPFYNPKDFSNDRYMQMAVLKNDLGELAEFSFNWEGKRGKISEMEDFQKEEFDELMKQKAQDKPDTGLNF